MVPVTISFIHQKNGLRKGRRILDLEITTSYIKPAHYGCISALEKVELFAGISPNFLVNPTGRGTVRFYSSEHPTEIILNNHLTTIFTKTWRWHHLLPIRALQKS